MDTIIPQNHIQSPSFLKQCSQCLETKLLSEFGTYHGKKNKRCKVCSKKSSYQATLQKQCVTCLEAKPLSEFGTTSEYGKNQSCKVCAKKAKYQRAIAEPGQTKQCTGCLETKPISAFSSAASGRYGVRSACKVCRNASQQERYKTGEKKPRKLNPNSGRTHKLRTNFNMTLTDYEEMLAQQNGVCAICGKPETAQTHTGVTRNLSVDHCHQTKVIRKLLCQGCNLMLGAAKDDPEILIKGAEYLNRYK